MATTRPTDDRDQVGGQQQPAHLGIAAAVAPGDDAAAQAAALDPAQAGAEGALADGGAGPRLDLEVERHAASRSPASAVSG